MVCVVRSLVSLGQRPVGICFQCRRICACSAHKERSRCTQHAHRLDLLWAPLLQHIVATDAIDAIIRGDFGPSHHRIAAIAVHLVLHYDNSGGICHVTGWCATLAQFRYMREVSNETIQTFRG
jgi:hypothetical protein